MPFISTQRVKNFWAICFPKRISDYELLYALNLSQQGLRQVNQAVEKNNLSEAKRCLVQYFRARKEPKFYFSIKNKESIFSIINIIFPNAKEKTIEKANKICQHRFAFLGSDEAQFRKRINWHYDFTGGRSWPYRLSKNIDCRGSKRIGDVKFTWEFNRHQYFLDLGKAYWYTGDEKYAREFAHQILSWIKQNPVDIGVNWDNALEVALRSISWIWGYSFFLQSESLDNRVHVEFLKSLITNARFIKNHLSVRGFNHLIGEAAGLAFIGILFPEFKEAEQWKDLGLRILKKEISRQIYPSGEHKEQSTAYHRFVLDFYLIIFILAELNGIRALRNIAPELEKMLEYLMYIAKPDKTIPMIGDSDDGKVIAIDTCASSDFPTTLAIGATLFNRPDLKFVSGESAEGVLWLLGSEQFEKYEQIISKAPVKNSIFYDCSGYYVMRTGWSEEDSYFIFDCGEQGIGSAGHGHADALSFEMSTYDKTMIIDPGTYTYNGSPTWRNYFRGTNAHNTVIIDGVHQSIPGSTFNWRHKAKTSLHKWETTDKYDFVDASHDGYMRLKEEVRHRRRVLFIKPEYWIIEDILTGNGKHKFQSRFHVTSNDIIVDKKSKAVEIRFDDAYLYLFLLESSEVNVDIESGWISPSYGNKLPATVICYSQQVSVPFSFIIVIYPSKVLCLQRELERQSEEIRNSQCYHSMLASSPGCHEKRKKGIGTNVRCNSR